MSPFTRMKVKPPSNSAVCNHILHFYILLSFGNFSILAHENKKYLLEIKENLLMMKDKSSLNRNIISVLFYLFDKVSQRVLAYFTLVYLTTLVYVILNIAIEP